MKYTPGQWHKIKYTTPSGKEQTIIQAAAHNVCRMDVAGRNPETLEGDSDLICLAPRLLFDLVILSTAVMSQHGEHDPLLCPVCEALLNAQELISIAKGGQQ